METMNESEDLQHVVATEEPAANTVCAEGADAALAAMDRRIRELEAAIGDLRSVKAQAANEPQGHGRKTVPAAQVTLLAKGGPEAGGAGVDEALRSLSVEQRIAVKAGLHRAGLLR